MTRWRRMTMGMVTLCAVGTFPSVWGSFALGPRLRLDHPACGVDDGGRMLWTLPIVQHRAMGRPEPSAVRWQCPVSSQGRMLSSRSDLPPGGEKNRRGEPQHVLHREDIMASLWIFPAPSVIVVTCHHMWSGTISSTTDGRPSTQHDVVLRMEGP